MHQGKAYRELLTLQLLRKQKPYVDDTLAICEGFNLIKIAHSHNDMRGIILLFVESKKNHSKTSLLLSFFLSRSTHGKGNNNNMKTT